MNCDLESTSIDALIHGEEVGKREEVLAAINMELWNQGDQSSLMMEHMGYL